MTDEQTKQLLKLLRDIDAKLGSLVAAQKASDDTLSALMASLEEPRKSTDAFFSQGLVQQARLRENEGI